MSPKSCEFPFDAIVIYSIVLVPAGADSEPGALLLQYGEPVQRRVPPRAHGW